MFIGHYGPTYAIKAGRPGIPLWVLFIAVQLLDVGWSIFVLLGIEKVRIVPGITASNPLDLYYMPYTHSLVAAVIWSAAAGVFVKLIRIIHRWLDAGWVMAAVFSHWVLDWLVHRPDLPLYDNTMKTGLGLWNFPVIALTLEAFLLFLGMSMYIKRTASTSMIGRFGPPLFGILIFALQVVVFFGPPPASPNAAAITALTSYILFAVVAQWLDRHRSKISQH